MAQHPDVQYIRFYTDGSAAKKMAPVAPLHTIRLPKMKKMKKLVLRIDPVAICGIIMAAIMLVLMTVGAVQLHNARKDLETMSAYVETLQQENASLQSTLSDGYNLADVERTALALGLVPREQVKHVTIQLPAEETEAEPNTWEQFYTFLTGLFA